MRLVTPITLNFVITHIPLFFLFGLCVIGIYWARKPQRCQNQHHLSTHFPSRTLPVDIQSLSNPGASHQVKAVYSYPYSQELEAQIARIIQEPERLESSTKASLVPLIKLTYTRTENDLHLIVKVSDPQVIHRFLTQLLNAVSEQPKLEYETQYTC